MKLKKIFLLLWMVLINTNTKAQHSITPKLSHPQSTSLVWLPDPQNYIKFGANQPVFELLTSWIAHNKENLNIRAALCTGDLVQHNNIWLADGVNADQNSIQQWRSVSKAFERLDNVLPYFLSPGNHDYGYANGENRKSQFALYFHPERNKQFNKTLAAIFSNGKEAPSLQNAAFELIIPKWKKLLFITTEFAPRDEVLDWVYKLSVSEEYKKHLLVFITHSYLKSDGTRIVKENYKMRPVNYGEEVWGKLLHRTSNIQLVLSGHYAQIGSFKDNVGYRKDFNTVSKTVHQIMFNAQTEGGGNGGDGWLRLLEFLPDGKTIKIRTYSPFFGFSPSTAHLAWRTEPWDEFEILVD
ncbi:MAG: metallophosphoesterase [Tenacibaculum sp.]